MRVTGGNGSRVRLASSPAWSEAERVLLVHRSRPCRRLRTDRRKHSFRGLENRENGNDRHSGVDSTIRTAPRADTLHPLPPRSGEIGTREFPRGYRPLRGGGAGERLPRPPGEPGDDRGHPRDGLRRGRTTRPDREPVSRVPRSGTTHTAETDWDDCGPVVDGRSIDVAPERRGRDTDDRKRPADGTRGQPSPWPLPALPLPGGDLRSRNRPRQNVISTTASNPGHPAKHTYPRPRPRHRTR